jgi:hypothetical protein
MTVEHSVNHKFLYYMTTKAGENQVFQ